MIDPWHVGIAISAVIVVVGLLFVSFVLGVCLWISATTPFVDMQLPTI